jgi:TonB family protein
LDRVPEAQELMIYRVRTAEKNHGEGNHKVIPVVCDLGDWFAEVGMPYEARMAFQMALSIAGTTPALNDSIIVEPLRGLGRTRMRLRSYPVSMRPKRRRLDTTTQWAFPKMGPREFDEEGEDALHRAVRIVESDPDASRQMRIETLIQMGDWYQIKKAPREALPYYQRAWELIHTAPSPSGSTTTALSVPLRVYYPTPDIVANVPKGQVQDARSHHVQVEFTVAADGSVRDALIVGHDTRDRYARDVLEAVRASRFRPKFVDGQPVAAPGISYREVFWTGKTPE